MQQETDRQRAIGVLVKKEDNPQGNSVTAGVAWGLLPYTVPQITADSERAAVEGLKNELEANHRVKGRPLVFFDDIQEAEDARWRNMNACRLLSGPFSRATRDSIAHALDFPDNFPQKLPKEKGTFDTAAQSLATADAPYPEGREYSAWYHEPDVLAAFDHVVEALGHVVAGTSGPLDLVPDFKPNPKDNFVYVPLDDPRSKAHRHDFPKNYPETSSAAD